MDHRPSLVYPRSTSKIPHRHNQNQKQLAPSLARSALLATTLILALARGGRVAQSRTTFAMTRRQPGWGTCTGFPLAAAERRGVHRPADRPGLFPACWRRLAHECATTAVAFERLAHAVSTRGERALATDDLPSTVIQKRVDDDTNQPCRISR